MLDSREFATSPITYCTRPMKKRIINVIATFYIVAAILVAHVSLASLEAANSECPTYGSEVVSHGKAMWDSGRLVKASAVDTYRAAGPLRPDRRDFYVQIVVEHGSKAGGEYRKSEVPTLLKYGYKVTMLYYGSTDEPTVKLYYKDDLIAERENWTAREIERFVRNRQKPKG